MQVHASKLPDKPESGVYNLVGDDIYWLNLATERLISIVGKSSLSARFFDKMDNVADIIGSLLSLNFMSEPNVVVVKNCKDFTKNDSKGHKLFLETLQSGIAPNYLVLINAELDSKEKALINEIDCSKLRKYDCINYAEKLFDGKIEKNALYKLADYTNCDLARIINEAEKLKSYCKDAVIKSIDVENLVAEDTDLQVFQFVNNIIGGNNELAVEQLQRLKKRGESPLMILAMLTNQFRRILHCALSDKSDAELAVLFNVKEYAIKKARENKHISVVKLKGIVEMLTEYELKFKSGEMSEQTAFDSAISRLLSREV